MTHTELFQLIGTTPFRVLAHHTIVGNQVIARGKGKTLVRTLLAALTVSIITITHLCNKLRFLTAVKTIIFR